MNITTAANVSMPRLIYGTAWKKERTAALVEKAIKSGFRGIDTACQPKHYHEAGVGEALSRLQDQGINRESLFIQTKFTSLGGQDPQRIPYDPKASLDDQVFQSFAKSQENLASDYVDSLVLHSPLANHDQMMTVWNAMEKLHDQGKARQLGISNCYQIEVLKKLFEDAKIKPAVLQNRFYQDSGYDHSIREWCKDKHIVYQSFWTLTANPHILQSSILQGIAAQYQKTAAQIFFRFLTQIGIVPLTGTTSDQHMKEDLAIFEFKLDQLSVSNLSRLIST